MSHRPAIPAANPYCSLALLFVAVSCVPPLPIELCVKQACMDSATFSYQPNPPLPRVPRVSSQSNNRTWSSCQLNYWPLPHPDQLVSVEVLYNYPTASRTIHIFNLSSHNTYVVFMACNQQFRSNNVTFKAGSVCDGSSVVMRQTEEEKDWHKLHSTPVLLEENGLAQMSSIDITLGIIFGIFGIVILVAAAFYFWKNHQHRQRILRVFGQEHRDPFQALHNMEESPIISL